MFLILLLALAYKVPNEVVGKISKHGVLPIRAWRELVARVADSIAKQL
ncbi:hypothetical protein [Duganella sp. HH105]|nr:hypothetical protein [Duganella sp. HH105]